MVLGHSVLSLVVLTGGCSKSNSKDNTPSMRWPTTRRVAARRASPAHYRRSWMTRHPCTGGKPAADSETPAAEFAGATAVDSGDQLDTEERSRKAPLRNS